LPIFAAYVVNAPDPHPASNVRKFPGRRWSRRKRHLSFVAGSPSRVAFHPNILTNESNTCVRERPASLVLIALASNYATAFSSSCLGSSTICKGMPWTVIFTTKFSAQLANNSAPLHRSASHGGDFDKISIITSYRKLVAEVRPFATELCPLQIYAKLGASASSHFRIC